MKAAVCDRYGPPEVLRLEAAGPAVTEFTAGDDVFGVKVG